MPDNETASNVGIVATEAVVNPLPATDQQPVDPSQAVSWTASEFISHEKSAGWYGALIVGALLLAAVLYLLTRDVIPVVVTMLAALLLGIQAAKPPRQLQYSFDEQGISVGPKRFNYSDFRAFSVAPEGAFSCITLAPLKRFAPPLSIYYPPDHEDAIMGVLSAHLPFEDRRPDAVDSLMRRIRF